MFYSSFPGLSFLRTRHEFPGADISRSTRRQQAGRSVPVARLGVHRQHGLAAENGRGQAAGDGSVGASDRARQQFQGEIRRVDGD